MTTVSQNIRGALQLRALATPGFPSSIAYEGQVYKPVIGQTWARLTVLPQGGRPYSVSAIDTYHYGLFQIDVMVPDGLGTGAAEAAGDAVRAMFRGGTTLRLGGDQVVIDYAERATAMQTASWIFCPVSVFWRCYSPSN